MGRFVFFCRNYKSKSLHIEYLYFLRFCFPFNRVLFNREKQHGEIRQTQRKPRSNCMCRFELTLSTCLFHTHSNNMFQSKLISDYIPNSLGQTVCRYPQELCTKCNINCAYNHNETERGNKKIVRNKYIHQQRL